MRPESKPINLSIGRDVFRLWFIAFAVLLLSNPADAKEEDDPLSYDRHIQRIFARHCYKCHNPEEPSGDVDLKSDENLRLILSHRKQWENVREVLKSGEMPPEDERQPDKEKRSLMIQFLDRTLDTLECNSDSNPKTPPARRLTRHQYNRTVADFTGLQLELADDFSPDPVSFGFEGISGSQGLTQVIVDQYADAATKISEALLASKQSHPHVYRRFFELTSEGEGETESPSQNSPSENSINDKTRLKQTRNRLRRLATKAHRGPASDSYINALMKVYEASHSSEGEHDVAMSQAIRGLLMSPRFFMRIESQDAARKGSDESKDDSGELRITKVDGMDLANRLAFFIWSSPPDAVLIKAARQGKLEDPEQIRKQARRMLKSDRVRGGLAKEFFGQWLQVKALPDHTVDSERFPDFSEDLRASMMGEVDHFVADVIINDRSISRLVDSDFTFLDDRLAKHYSLQELRANKKQKPHTFVKVNLKDRRRGGLLTSAALLTLQADPGRTNIPRRGNYIAGTFIADPPPPPPPDVPALKESDEGSQSMTLRERFEKHRSDAACASCHAKMDPLGFSLEHYDAIGRWREKDNGLPIDTQGELPSGDKLDGVVSLKDFLLKKQTNLARSLTESLIVYAYGRGLIPEDECVVREALESCEKNDGKFSALIDSIVTSRAFRYRSN